MLGFSFLKSRFKKPVIRPPATIPIEDIKLIWNYQIVVIPFGSVIDLKEPVIDLYLDLNTDPVLNGHQFPLIVKDDGSLLSPTFGRRVICRDNDQRTALYLEYPLDKIKKSKVILRIYGKDPQSVHVVKDERRTYDSPLILFVPRRKLSGAGEA